MSVLSLADRVERKQRLIESARLRGTPMGINFALPSAALIEITGKYPFDYLVVDQEHTIMGDPTQLSDLARACDLTGMPWFVKVPKPEHLRVRDAMDSGAYGVMLPQVGTATLLRELMQQILMPPIGRRGVCSLSRATWHVGRPKYLGSADRRPVLEYRDWVNQHMVVIPTIESVEGIKNLDAILEVPGYEVVHIGLEDIWMSMTGGNDMPAAKAAAAEVAKKVRDAGKIVMMFGEVDDPPRDRGPLTMTYTVDTWCYAYGLLSALKSRGT